MCVCVYAIKFTCNNVHCSTISPFHTFHPFNIRITSQPGAQWATNIQHVRPYGHIMIFHDFSTYFPSLIHPSSYQIYQVLPSSHPSFGLSTCSPWRMGAITGALSLRGAAWRRGSGRPEPSSRGPGCSSKGNSSGGRWVTGGNSRGFCLHWFSWDHLRSSLEIWPGSENGGTVWYCTISLAIFSGEVPWNLGLENRPYVW